LEDDRVVAVGVDEVEEELLEVLLEFEDLFN